ncbi:nuclear transport factor 2 family protein [Leucobacter weissii]|uniref:Nuclear transport factor 2 family protein n=1 Tax=Leucobacter weissii TaxID=1983706 RepID=A0A939ML65_9MICO|nr:nuclear transport factor 2 family protein [Leucobacter weissii]MBO1900456.1 nuclear transport factor 2 family protein [Leucobacter weissii]
MVAESSLPAPVQRFVDAINAADTDAFVDAFTPDGLVDDWGRELHGPDGLRSWADTDAIGMNARITILSADVDGDTVTTRFDWASRRFNGRSEGIFVIAGDRLSSFTIPPHR